MSKSECELDLDLEYGFVPESALPRCNMAGCALTGAALTAGTRPPGGMAFLVVDVDARLLTISSEIGDTTIV